MQFSQSYEGVPTPRSGMRMVVGQGANHREDIRDMSKKTNKQTNKQIGTIANKIGQTAMLFPPKG